jgi:hypothetical protein
MIFFLSIYITYWNAPLHRLLISFISILFRLHRVISCSVFLYFAHVDISWIVIRDILRLYLYVSFFHECRRWQKLKSYHRVASLKEKQYFGSTHKYSEDKMAKTPGSNQSQTSSREINRRTRTTVYNGGGIRCLGGVSTQGGITSHRNK